MDCGQCWNCRSPDLRRLGLHSSGGYTLNQAAGCANMARPKLAEAMFHRIQIASFAIIACLATVAAKPLGPCMLQPQYLLFFASNETSPTSPDPRQNREAQLLDAIADGWKASPTPLVVIGHTDEVETHAALHLDAGRADAVRNALVQRGVDPAAITTQADAFNTPMVPLSGPEIQNRYVSVTAPDLGASCSPTPGVVR